METAPKDGSIIVVLYNAYNVKTEPEMVAFAQWWCDTKCRDWRWCMPHNPDRTQYAKAWMTQAEFMAECRVEEEQAARAAAPEFDL